MPSASISVRIPLVHPADLGFAGGSEADGEPEVAGLGEVVFDPAVGQENDFVRLSGDGEGEGAFVAIESEIPAEPVAPATSPRPPPP